MDQQATPLFTALLKHASGQPIPFHIPGHKQGRGADPQFREFVGDNTLSIDLINIAPLDDLHQPTGVILEAERLAANAFDADYTLFSVQGTTGAIMTMIMSCCSPGDKIILPRNAHKSIMSAVIFAGAVPVWLTPRYDDNLGIEHSATLGTIREAIEQNLDAKAVLLINPTYYGTTMDLLTAVDMIHSYGMPVLVDEAHGTMLQFHEKLPISAMQAGADMAATSVHKLGGSMTQSSILNVKGDRVNIRRVRTIMSMLTTTSTSYLLLASLDTARRQLAIHGHAMIEESIRIAQLLRRRINDIPGLYCFGEEICGQEGVFSYDPTKLCIHIAGLDINGFEAEKWLRDYHGIEVELSDLSNILCLITIGDTEGATENLLSALKDMADKHPLSEGTKPHVSVPVKPADSQIMVQPREAFYSESEPVPLVTSNGRVSAEFLYVYPPGIPVLIPGQYISTEILAYIIRHIKSGLPVKGPEDSTLQSIKVIKEMSRETNTTITKSETGFIIPD